MKTSLLTCLCSIALFLSAYGQTPTPSIAAVSPTATAVATASPTAVATLTPAVTVSATPNDADEDIARIVRSKLNKHHINLSVGRHHDHDLGDFDSSDGALMAIPIVGIVFTTLFGAPVLIVAAIMFFSYLRSRSLHRTVRMMVEKGQPVPPELFAAPGTKIRTRSDLRRGVILITVGVGLMIFFGAVSDWERGGPWVIGVIPFLIGAAYLALGKLETPRHENNTLRDDRPVS